MRRAHVAVVCLVAVAWVAAAWALLGTVVPDVALPSVDVDRVLGDELVADAERYERFLYADWVLAQLVAFTTLAVYARYGVRYARESAAGPIGTGKWGTLTERVRPVIGMRSALVPAALVPPAVRYFES